MNTPTRRGFTLIELSTVIVVCTVIAGMAIWLVHASMKRSRDGQRGLALQNTVARMAETFRADAHAATAIVEEKAAKKDKTADHIPAWTITLTDGRSVRYRFESGSLDRSLFTAAKNDSKKDAAQALSRDSFKLPPGVLVSIQLDPPSQPQIASLLILPAKDPADSPSQAAKPRIRPLRIDAAIGTDTRFEKVAIQTDEKTAPDQETKK